MCRTGDNRITHDTRCLREIETGFPHSDCTFHCGGVQRASGSFWPDSNNWCEAAVQNLKRGERYTSRSGDVDVLKGQGEAVKDSITVHKTVRKLLRSCTSLACDPTGAPETTKTSPAVFLELGLAAPCPIPRLCTLYQVVLEQRPFTNLKRWCAPARAGGWATARQGTRHRRPNPSPPPQWTSSGFVA